MNSEKMGGRGAPCPSLATPLPATPFLKILDPTLDYTVVVDIVLGDVVKDKMLVTHFLLETTSEGIRLKGWSEKPFSKFNDLVVGNDNLLLRVHHN